MSLRLLIAALALAGPVLLAQSQPAKSPAPESFRANGQVTGAAGGVAAAILIRIDRYPADADRDAMASVLQERGFAPFVETLQKAPQIGLLTVGERTFPIRWARTLADGRDHRRITVVTDQPVYFAGAGAVDAPSTAGFELALLDFTVDSVGLGSGTMAPAARVKPGGSTGVEVEDYGGKRITLVTVTRELK